jgi:hypothetical protein
MSRPTQAGEPILARPVGRLERLLKWARRRPAVAALSGSLLAATLLLLGGLVIGIGLISEALAQALAAQNQQAEQRLAAEKARDDKEAARQAAVRAGEAESQAKQAAQLAAAAERQAKEMLCPTSILRP